MINMDGVNKLVGDHIEMTNDKGSEQSNSDKMTNPKDALGIAKAPFHCVSARVMLELGLAMMEGGRKYGTHNYRSMGVRASVYYDATMRHMMAYWEGQDVDPDSGVSHIVKAIAGLVVMRDSMLMRNFEDDRPIRLPDQLNIDDLNEQAKDIIKKYPVCKMPFIHAGPKLVMGVDISIDDSNACAFGYLDVECGCGRCRAEREVEAMKKAKPEPDASRAGHDWSTYEEIMLRREVGQDLPMTAIASLHRRSVIAIGCRMENMNIDYNAKVKHEENKVTYDDAVDGECYGDDRLCHCRTCRAGWSQNLIP